LNGWNFTNRIGWELNAASDQDNFAINNILDLCGSLPKKFIHHLSWCLPVLSLGLFSSSAAPSIQFDTKTFECGTIVEGKAGTVNAVFKVKNTGDSVLRLESVRPSCWCVLVRYDSLIQPGATAHIEAFINTKGFHSGPVTKWIAVSSNAKNEPTARLTIKAVFQAQIDVLNKYLVFNESRSGKDTLYLATKKNDFKITGVEFFSSDSNNASNDLTWQPSLPLVITFITLFDSTRADGSKVFSYELVPVSFKKSQGGFAAIRTNHPEKPEIKLPATLLK
jgi:hypothetical protein